MILPEFSENHHSVVTAEAEVAVERNLHLPFPGGVRRNIQITGRIRSLVVDRRRNDAGFNRFDAGDRFQPARSAEAVTGGPFCAAHRNLVAGSGEQSTFGGEQTGAAENNTGTAQTDPAPGAEPSSAPGTASGSETAETAAQVWQEYTVQKGDSLSKISERYYGTMSRVKDICELNQIAVEDLIYAGQKIYLPK